MKTNQQMLLASLLLLAIHAAENATEFDIRDRLQALYDGLVNGEAKG